MKTMDLHTHGIGGFDTKTADPVEIGKIAEFHGAYGVDAIIPTIYPAPISEMRRNMIAVKQAMEMQKTRHKEQGTRYEVRAGKDKEPGIRSEVERENNEDSSVPFLEPLALNPNLVGTSLAPAVILGVHLEGPFLNAAECGALDGRSFLVPHAYHLEALLEGLEDVVRIVTIAPELEGALRLITIMSDRGIGVNMGHSQASFREGEAGFHAGAKGITHLFNAMRGIHHREPGLAGFGLLNRHIYVEVIGDPYHLGVETLELIFRMKDPERIIMVSDAVRETGIRSAGSAMRDGEGRLAGGAMSVTESVQRLTNLGFDPGRVMETITINPSRYLMSQ